MLCEEYCSVDATCRGNVGRGVVDLCREAANRESSYYRDGCLRRSVSGFGQSAGKMRGDSTDTRRNDAAGFQQSDIQGNTEFGKSVGLGSLELRYCAPAKTAELRSRLRGLGFEEQLHYLARGAARYSRAQLGNSVNVREKTPRQGYCCRKTRQDEKAEAPYRAVQRASVRTSAERLLRASTISNTDERQVG